jgi:hypothetical protein
MAEKYELKDGNILKDGHTMFLEDVVGCLERKSYLEDLRKPHRVKLNRSGILKSGWVIESSHYAFMLKKDCDYYIMSVNDMEDGLFLILIKLVSSETKCNIWENSETFFYGNLKTMGDLESIMKFLDITHD